jgi:hypothetical protein
MGIFTRLRVLTGEFVALGIGHIAKRGCEEK